MKLAVVTSHPIQYQAPLFRELAKRCDLTVFFAHRQSAQQQAEAGYGVAFEWDSDLLLGYNHVFLQNISPKPDVTKFGGCDAPEIADHVRRGKFNALLLTGWHLKVYWQAALACRRHGVPMMVRGDSQLGTPRGVVKRVAKRFLYPLLLRQFSAALYVGQRNREYLAHYHMPSDRMYFSPHCVDINAYSTNVSSTQRQAMRDEWGVGINGFVALFVGRMMPFKRPEDMVLAIKLLRDRGMDVTGVFAGAGVLRATLEALGKTHGVPLVFLGFCNQSALPMVYAAADALVLPSSGEETWGLVVNEALVCGTPCAVSDACGCAPDMIVRGETGDVFPVGNVAALADAIMQCLRIQRNTSALQLQSDRYSVKAASAGVMLALKNIGTAASDAHY